MPYSRSLIYPIISTFLFFCIAAIMGIFMRMAYVVNLPSWFNYKNILHTHSHIALLGWLFASVCLIIIYLYQLPWKKYKNIFWSLQVASIGMLFTFPVTGYALPSIIFSTLHIFISFYFLLCVWNDTTRNKLNSPLSILFLRTSIVFYMLSTLGPLSLGPISSLSMKGSALYYGAIQFYLHFLFNGWFIFILIAIFFQYLNNHNIIIPVRKGKLFYNTLTISTILTFALAITWSNPYFFIFMINSIGIAIQLLSLFIFLKILHQLKDNLIEILNPYLKFIFTVVLIAFAAKILIQTCVVFPYIADVSYTIRKFVVGFIHLLLLGCISLFILAMYYDLTGIKSKAGTYILLSGIVFTEFFLFIQGLFLWMQKGFIPGYYLIMVIGSVIMLIGIISIIYGNIISRKMMRL